jgi:nucleotide-binding universal stress UspA family protein
LHPTDFSAPAEKAFAHALALALLGRSRLTLLHIGPEHGHEVDWSRFPSVRGTLERWGQSFDEQALRVAKLSLRRRRAKQAVVDFAEKENPDLIVLATAGRHGLPRWLQPSLAEPIARHSTAHTLFVQDDVEGFVSTQDGTVRLRRVLMPIDQAPDPRGAIEAVRALAQELGPLQGSGIAVTLLHVTDEPGTVHDFLSDLGEQLPTGQFHGFSIRVRAGHPVDAILQAAEDERSDLIAMATAGHHGILDALRGSTTERVLRRAPCPVLAIPSRP